MENKLTHTPSTIPQPVLRPVRHPSLLSPDERKREEEKTYMCSTCRDDSVESRNIFSLGYAVSIIDPETGEMVASTSEELDPDATPAEELLCDQCMAEQLEEYVRKYPVYSVPE